MNDSKPHLVVLTSGYCGKKRTQYIAGNEVRPVGNPVKKNGDADMDINKYLDITNENIRQMEQRIVEERRLSEERMEKRYSDVMDVITNLNKRTDEKIKETNELIQTKHDKIMNSLDTTKRWVMGLCLGTIIGIAAMVVAVLVR